jgi:hypothetical protein
MSTILPGTPEIFEDENPVIQKLIDIRSRSPLPEDREEIIEELRWYQALRDNAESIPEEDRINWKNIHREFKNLSDDQIVELIHLLEESENGDYINQ